MLSVCEFHDHYDCHECCECRPIDWCERHECCSAMGVLSALIVVSVMSVVVS